MEEQKCKKEWDIVKLTVAYYDLGLVNKVLVVQRIGIRRVGYLPGTHSILGAKGQYAAKIWVY